MIYKNEIMKSQELLELYWHYTSLRGNNCRLAYDLKYKHGQYKINMLSKREFRKSMLKFKLIFWKIKRELENGKKNCPSCNTELRFDDRFYDAYCPNCNYAELNGENNYENIKR